MNRLFSRAIVVLFLLSACQSAPPEPMPTLIIPPTEAATVTLAPLVQVSPIIPTRELVSLLPSETLTIEVTRPVLNGVRLVTLEPTPVNTLPPTSSITLLNTSVFTGNTATPQPTLPSVTATPLPAQFIFGRSVGGRDLMGYRFGTGQYVVMLVGGIHAGFEQNTITLIERLRDHFSANPQDIPPNVTVIFIPVLNPDGYARGAILEGRFNGNNVDLNRNWGCEWQTEAFFRDQPVSAGANAFSESESVALGSLIQQVRPQAVLFYHAAANGIFAGQCEGVTNSSEMVALYSQASGYPAGVFTDYVVSGTAPNWVDSQGIASADIELATADDVELLRNLNAVRAILTWAGRPRS
jgi:hypothetical protein